MNGVGGKSVRGIAGFLGLAMTLGAAACLSAEDTESAPGRAVRLSDAEGRVQVSQTNQDSSFTSNGVANTPLFEGTLVATGDDGRAELQFDDGSVARIPPNSSLTLSVVQQGQTEVAVNGGLVYIEAQDGFRVRFADSVATASGFTVLRVKMDQAPGELAVFSGNAHLEGGGKDLDLRGGQSMSFPGADGAGLTASDSIEPDSWDTWNSDRDQAVTSSETPAGPSEYDNSKNPAWNDLNENGTWYDVPDQGYVWSPYAASSPDWDPYGVGYWVWTPRNGYVWVSGYSWGYMPYHCGNWNYYSTFGWGWAPGPCQTWWAGNGGGGDWYFNVGTTPRWYRLPVRPGPPHPRDPHPRVRPVGPEPVITVRRTGPRDGDRNLPPREGGTPVLLGGRIARPVLPTPRRVEYDHVTVTTNRPPAEKEDGPRAGYVRGTPKMGGGFGIFEAKPKPSDPRPSAPPETVRTTPTPRLEHGFEQPHSGSHPAPPPSDGGRSTVPVSRPAPAPVQAPSHPAPAPAPVHSSPAPAPAPSHSAPAAPSSSHNK